MFSWGLEHNHVLLSLLWLRFDPWPWNFHMPWVWPTNFTCCIAQGTVPKVVLDNRIALDYLLAKLAVCAMTNTTYYNWIDTFGDAETQLYKIND